MFPVLQRATQIPRAGLKIGFWIEKLIGTKVVDFLFARPLAGRSFAYLHQPALAGGTMFSRIKPALPPHHRLHQHWVEMMLQRDGANQRIVLMKPGRTHPFVKCINRITGLESQISKTRRYREQYAKDQFEEKSYHFGIKSRAPARLSN